MKKGIILIYTGLLLIAAALCITGYNIIDDLRAQDASRDILEQLRPYINDDPVLMPEDPASTDGSDEIEYPSYVVSPEMDMPETTISGFGCIGVLSLPTLELEFPVFSSLNKRALSLAPCRYRGSAYLDNMVICAHNYDSHFGRIKDFHIGDFVIFTDIDGNTFAYQVMEIETLSPTEYRKMTQSEWDLTLFTCTVNSRKRVTVRCERCK